MKVFGEEAVCMQAVHQLIVMRARIGTLIPGESIGLAVQFKEGLDLIVVIRFYQDSAKTAVIFCIMD